MGNSLGNGRGYEKWDVSSFNGLQTTSLCLGSPGNTASIGHCVASCVRSIFVMSRGKERDSGTNVLGFSCLRKNLWSENFRCRRKYFMTKSRIVISYGGEHLSIEVAVTKVQEHKGVLLGFG